LCLPIPPPPVTPPFFFFFFWFCWVFSCFFFFFCVCFFFFFPPVPPEPRSFIFSILCELRLNPHFFNINKLIPYRPQASRLFPFLCFSPLHFSIMGSSTSKSFSLQTTIGASHASHAGFILETGTLLCNVLILTDPLPCPLFNYLV